MSENDYVITISKETEEIMERLVEELKNMKPVPVRHDVEGVDFEKLFRVQGYGLELARKEREAWERERETAELAAKNDG